MTISEFIDSLPLSEKMKAVNKNIKVLRYMKNQPLEICIDIVKGHGYHLEFITNQTPEICLEAVKRYPYALNYVKKNR